MKLRAGGAGHLDELMWLERLLLQELDLSALEDTLLAVVSGISVENPSWNDLRQVDDTVKAFYSTRVDAVTAVIVRAFVLGTLIERSEARGLRPMIDVGTLPQTVKQAAIENKLTAKETKALEFSITHGAKHLTDAQDSTVKIVQEAVFKNVSNHGTPRGLKKQLQATFADDDSEFNRNWHRVAINETNTAYNSGYLEMSTGHFVMWAALPGCCEYCASMDGRVFYAAKPTGNMNYSDLEIASPEYKNKAWLWDNAVWSGKDNVGRSRHANKRTEDGKAAREHHERYTPCIPAHPECRCHWIRINPDGVYVKNRKIEFRSKSESEWEKWYNREIGPKVKGIEDLKGLAG